MNGDVGTAVYDGSLDLGGEDPFASYSCERSGILVPRRLDDQDLGFDTRMSGFQGRCDRLGLR
jgi:hypothetical protein